MTSYIFLLAKWRCQEAKSIFFLCVICEMQRLVCHLSYSICAESIIKLNEASFRTLFGQLMLWLLCISIVRCFSFSVCTALTCPSNYCQVYAYYRRIFAYFCFFPYQNTLLKAQQEEIIFSHQRSPKSVSQSNMFMDSR